MLGEVGGCQNSHHQVVWFHLANHETEWQFLHCFAAGICIVKNANFICHLAAAVPLLETDNITPVCRYIIDMLDMICFDGLHPKNLRSACSILAARAPWPGIVTPLPLTITKLGS